MQNLNLNAIIINATCPPHEILVEIHFIVKPLKKGLNEGLVKFLVPLFCKTCHLLIISDTALIF